MPAFDGRQDARSVAQTCRTSRRGFLQGAGAAAAAAVLSAGAQRSRASEAAAGPLAFFVISDTHLLADRQRPERLTTESAELNRRLIETLNGLPGQQLPAELGGGTVAEPRGVLHLGDIVDSGDKHGGVYEQMTDTEWQHYVALYGLTGRDGQLRFPIYELHGNHDSPRQRNTPLEGIIHRNRRRSGLTNISDNGLHYSWDWAGIHFVALGIVVGPNADDLPISRYDAWQSLPFLIADLEKHVGDSGRPVVLLHHVDLLRYSRPCNTEQLGGSRAICCPGMARIAWCSSGCSRSPGISADEWSACDVRAYHRAVQPYNVAAIFHGHLHGRRIERWHGSPGGDGAPAGQEGPGIPVFGSSNSGAGGGDRALFYCCVEDQQLVIREYRSRGQHGWHPELAQTAWSPEVWRVHVGHPH